jgi:copper transport protein
LRVHLQPDLAPGTYVVAWRATSLDGHPVRGAFTFSVGVRAEGASPVSREDRTGLIARVVPAEHDRGWQVAAAITRWLIYAGAFLAAGGVAFLLFVHRGFGDTLTQRVDDHLHEAMVERAALAQIVRMAALVAALATVASLAWQAALTSGMGTAAIGNGRILVDVLRSGFGGSALVRMLGLIVLLLAVTRLSSRAGRVAAGVGAAATVGSFIMTGHTVATSPRVFASVANLGHAAAGAVWFGGLVLLFVVLRRRKVQDNPIGASQLIARFSWMATIAVVVVIAGGLGLAWSQVRATRALTSTPYGWTLIAKVAVVALVIALGVYNQRRLVPKIAALAQRVQGTSPDRRDAWGTLRRTVRIETIGIFAVFAVTAVLVDLVPARTAAGVTGPFTATTPMGTYQLNVTVDPNRAGANELHMYLLGPGGQPTNPTPGEPAQLEVGFSLPSQDIGPIMRTAAVSGPGHWTLAGRELSIPGQWQVQFQLPISRFEQLTTELTVPVNP